MEFPTRSNSMDKNEGNTPIEASDFDVVSFLKKRISEVNNLRYGIERVWYRNVLFYVGKQWIKYDNKQRKWVRPNLPEWMPTPVTNRFASTCDIMASVLAQVKPEIVYSPASSDEKDIQASKVANTICDICEDESGYKRKKDKLRSWLTLTGNAFLYTHYDTDMKHGTVDIPVMGCPVCGFKGQPHEFGSEGQVACPQCQNPEVSETGEVHKAPRGKITTEVIPPFEIYVDLQVEDLQDQPYVLRCSTLPVSVIKQRWGDRAKDVKPQGTIGQLGQYYYQSLAYITNSSDTGFGSGTEYGGGIQPDKATVWEVFVPASQTMPEGYHGFVCDEIVLQEGPLEYHDTNGKPFIPIIHIKAQDTPKRFFAKAIADDLVHKQIQRNKLEAFIQLASHRTSNPVWLLPNSCAVETLTGEPGEVVRYNDANTANAKPERLAGTEITQSIFRWLEKIDSDFEELASTYDILKGSMPQNVPTLGGLELLKERAISRFSRIIENLEQAQLQLSRHWLYVWKEYVTEPRTKLSKDANGGWAEEAFNNASIEGDVDIKVEPGSSNPRSEAYQQFIAGQLLSNGMLDMNDVFTRVKILRTYHAEDFAETLKQDVEDAAREEELFLQMQPPALRPDVDNHQVHIASHTKFAKTERFRQLAPELQNLWMEHLLMQKQMMVVQMQNLAMMQGPAASPAQPGGGGGGSAPKGTQQSGDAGQSQTGG